MTLTNTPWCYVYSTFLKNKNKLRRKKQINLSSKAQIETNKWSNRWEEKKQIIFSNKIFVANCLQLKHVIIGFVLIDRKNSISLHLNVLRWLIWQNIFLKKENIKIKSEKKAKTWDNCVLIQFCVLSCMNGFEWFQEIEK